MNATQRMKWYWAMGTLVAIICLLGIIGFFNTLQHSSQPVAERQGTVEAF